MKKEKELHQLIRALTPAEKKYIGINIRKFRPTEANKKALLFDTLNSQKKHVPNQTHKIYKEYGYTHNFLAADRNQLYDLVLEGLTEFHSKNSLHVQIAIGYQKVVLLFEKKLFDQALKQISKIEKIAKKAEAFGMLVSLSQLKRRIYKINSNIDEAISSVKIQKEFWEQQEKVNQLVELHYESIRLRIKIGKARSEENIKLIDSFIQHELLQNIPKNDSYQVQFQFWETYCNYYFIKDKKQKELEANQALVDLIDKHPQFKKDEPLNHLVFCTRILAIQRNLYPEKFWANLEKYRLLDQGFSKQRLQAESIIFIFSYNYEMDFYINHKQWEKGLIVLPKITKGLKKYDSYIREPLKITAFYRTAYIYFFNQLYDNSLDALTIVIENYSSQLRPDVYSFALILKIIIHYEMGNLRLMQYLIKTAQYHITKRNLMFQTEKIAIQYLKKLSRKSNQKKHKIIFNNFYKDIIDLTNNNEYERRSLEIFDFETWLAYKTHN